MKTYVIEINNVTAGFFEDVAIIAQRPVEELLAEMLIKQVEIICRTLTESCESEEE